MEGGDFGGSGCGGGPCQEHVEREFGGGKKEVPKVRGESDVGGGEARDKMVFCSAYGAFGAEGTVLTRGGEGDSDVGKVEEVKQWL